MDMKTKGLLNALCAALLLVSAQAQACKALHNTGLLPAQSLGQLPTSAGFNKYLLAGLDLSVSQDSAPLAHVPEDLREVFVTSVNRALAKQNKMALSHGHDLVLITSYERKTKPAEFGVGQSYVSAHCEFDVTLLDQHSQVVSFTKNFMAGPADLGRRTNLFSTTVRGAEPLNQSGFPLYELWTIESCAEQLVSNLP